ncbi:FBD domain [Dillenia turbinata]|uniref:FBD domain n=1 Tax=Dillenia turbinata TaxID=194707 RepID=A0AAN8V8X1_9MAGN
MPRFFQKIEFLEDLSSSRLDLINQNVPALGFQVEINNRADLEAVFSVSLNRLRILLPSIPQKRNYVFNWVYDATASSGYKTKVRVTLLNLAKNLCGICIGLYFMFQLPKIIVLIEFSKCEDDDKDLISKLPDEILVSILSRLALREAARTSILAQRWRYLWRYSTKLSLHDKEGDEFVQRGNNYNKKEANAYIKAFNKVLRLHRAERLDEFRVCFILRNSHKKHLDKWIDHALRREVKKLEINLCQEYHYLNQKPYKFPDKCFVLVQNPQGLSSVKSLKSLYLKWLDVSGELIQNFLLNFPLLEHVTVHGSSEMIDLEVVGFSLKLIYIELYGCIKLRSVKIFAPNLVSFKCEFGESTILDFSQLETLKLDLLFHYDIHLPQIPEFTNLKHLILKILPAADVSLLCLAPVIEAATFLQKLSVKFIGMPEQRRRHMKRLPRSPNEHLKVVELFGFIGNVLDIEFAEYLLEKAVALEKVFIEPAD